MKLIVDNGPHLKDNDHTTKIMKRLMIALLPIVIFAFYKNGVIPYQKGYISFYQLFRPLLIITLASFTSLLAEVIYIRFVLKLKKDAFSSYLKYSYPFFPGLFLALIIPLNTPLWLVLLGAVIATIVGKMLFGGFGYNIFNPALIGALFITFAYGSLLASRGGYLNALEIDTISKATPLTNLSNLGYLGSLETVFKPFGSVLDYLFGFIPGAIGETSKILILGALVFLIATKVIKWIIPVAYLFTVFIMTFIIGYYNDLGLWYSLFHLLSGGLIFGATFMATDPVTSPVTKTGQFLFALGLGLLTVIFRFLTPYPEGVMTAILSMNMMVFIFDKIGSKSKFNSKIKIGYLVSLILLILGTSFYIGYQLKKESLITDDLVNIIKVDKSINQTIYQVTTKGFKGLIEAELTFDGSTLKKIDIITENESYWAEIERLNYLDLLIDNQDNIKEVDTISGATVSSSSLKWMVEYVLEYHLGDS